MVYELDQPRVPAAPRRWLVTGSITIVSLVPYLTLPVPFDRGLEIQAGLILAILSLLGFLWRKRIPGAVAEMPRALKLGLALYGGAALWGGTVALASGNPFRHLIAQLLSMLLLPAGAIIFAGASRSVGRELASGLALAALAALAIHLGAAALGFEPAAAARLPSLFKLPNGVDFVGPALLASLLCSGWWAGERSSLAAVGGVAGTLLVVGGMSRAQWLAGLAGIITLAVCVRRWRFKHLAIAGLALGAMTLLVGAAYLATSRSSKVLLSHVPEDSTAPLDREGGRFRPRTGAPEARRLAAIDLPSGYDHLEAEIVVQGDPGETITLWLTGRSTEGARLERRWEESLRSSGETTRLAVMAKLSDRVEWLGIGLRATRGDWTIRSLRVTAYDSEAAWWSRRLSWRARSLLTAFETPMSVGTLRYRIEESQSVLDDWRRASLPRLLVGQGLGAVYSFENVGWDEHGRRILLPEASYIHNFYLFLGYKLGLAGIAALAGLFILAGWTIRRGWMLRDRPQHWFTAAAGSAWFAYLLWSVTSPEILNFRMAPLWGLLAVASWKSSRKLPAQNPNREIAPPTPPTPTEEESTP